MLLQALCITGVTVWKHSIHVKIGDFWFHVTMKFYRWPTKTEGHLFYATSSFVHHSVAICEFKLELWSRKSPKWGKIYFDLRDLDLWPLTLTFCMDITFINGNNLRITKISFMMIQCDDWKNIYILSLIIIIKTEAWIIIYCLGLGHETMVCTVCVSIFLYWREQHDIILLHFVHGMGIIWCENVSYHCLLIYIFVAWNGSLGLIYFSRVQPLGHANFS